MTALQIIALVIAGYVIIGWIVGLWWASYDVYQNLTREQFSEQAAQAVLFWPVVVLLYLFVRIGVWGLVAELFSAPVVRWHEGTETKLDNERKRKDLDNR